MSAGQRTIGREAAGPVVRVQGLGKSFGAGNLRVDALSDITLAVQPGELLMLVGPSGCGKTTLLSILAGLLEPDRGEVWAFGEHLRGLSEAQRARLRRTHIGFIFQSYQLLPCLNVEDNVAIPLTIQGLPRRECRQRARAMLAQVGLEERRLQFPGTLSGGQQQRVAIARALIHQPRLVICDEPTSALDQDNGRRVMELLRQTALDGTRAVVTVTHDTRILSHADRIAVIEDGRLVSIERGAESALVAQDAVSCATPAPSDEVLVVIIDDAEAVEDAVEVLDACHADHADEAPHGTAPRSQAVMPDHDEQGMGGDEDLLQVLTPGLAGEG